MPKLIIQHVAVLIILCLTLQWCEAEEWPAQTCFVPLSVSITQQAMANAVLNTLHPLMGHPAIGNLVLGSVLIPAVSFHGIWHPHIGVMITVTLSGLAIWIASGGIYLSIDHALRIWRGYRAFQASGLPSVDDFLAAAEKDRVTKEELHRLLQWSDNTGTLFRELQRRSLLKAADFQEVPFKWLMMRVWFQLPVIQDLWKASPLADSKKHHSRVISSGGRHFHLLAVKHGFNVHELRAIAGRFAMQGWPLYLEENFKSRYRLRYGKDIGDHVVKSKQDFGFWSYVLALPSLFILIFIGQIWIGGGARQRNIILRYVPMHLDAFDEEGHAARDLFMAKAAWADRSGQKDIGILSGFAHGPGIMNFLLRLERPRSFRWTASEMIGYAMDDFKELPTNDNVSKIAFQQAVMIFKAAREQAGINVAEVTAEWIYARIRPAFANETLTHFTAYLESEHLRTYLEAAALGGLSRGLASRLGLEPMHAAWAVDGLHANILSEKIGQTSLQQDIHVLRANLEKIRRDYPPSQKVFRDQS